MHRSAVRPRRAWGPVVGLIAALCLVPAIPAFAADDAPKVIRKGGVTFYPDQRRIEIGGKICLAEGPIELLACAQGGKEYESVISLDVNPEILHFCLVLMRLKPGATGPKYQGDPENAPTGDPVVIKVRWKDGDADKEVRAEQFCWNTLDKRVMEETPWVFAGSKRQKNPDTGKEEYVANYEKSVIVVFRDPFSVLDLPLASSANDETYVVNKQIVPKVGTPVVVVIEPAPALAAAPLNAAGGRIVLIDVTGGGRVLVGDQEPAIENLSAGLAEVAKAHPKDSYRVTVDHGAPAKAAAAAFEALAAAKVVVESVATVRVRPEVTDRVSIAVSGEKLLVQGREVSEDQARVVVQGLGARGGGVGVAVGKGASWKAVAAACRAAEGMDGAVLRIFTAQP